MEIRANYILVGLFTLLILLGGLAFTLWTASLGKDVPMVEYDISFTESVKGLSVNSDVLFIGIRVGKVTRIKISDITPGEVKVRIQVAADTPVREDSVAQLEIRGLTGGVLISITGGTAQSPLKHVPEGAVGVIDYEPSPLTSVVAQMPDVLSSVHQTLRRVEKVFSDENSIAVSNILTSLDAFSTVLANRSHTIDTILLDAEKLARNFDLLAANANEALVTDVKATTQSMNSIAKRVDRTLTGMEPGLRQFSTQGLSEFRMLMVEARNLVHVLTRLSQKMESDPRRYLFGVPVKEVTNP